VKKLDFKLILSIILLIFVSIPMFTSSFLDFKQRKEQEKIEQKIIQEELIQKKIEENAIKKIYLMGKFEPSTREDFVLIPKEYTVGENKMYLRKETLDAFLKMQELAKKEKIELKVASATRNFNYQKNIWNRKWTGYTLVEGKNLLKSIPNELERFKKILEYSSVPGISRHHWGSDLDINDANPEYFEKESGKKVYDWLVKNAWEFGFCQPYNSKQDGRLSGYNEEKWHWSYLPISKDLTQEYKNLIKEEDISDFLGDEKVLEQDLINDYVLSINTDCI